MGNGIIAFLVAVSGVVWIYSKMMRKTGNNTANALTVGGIVGVIIFVAVLLLLGLIPDA